MRFYIITQIIIQLTEHNFVINTFYLFHFFKYDYFLASFGQIYVISAQQFPNNVFKMGKRGLILKITPYTF